MDGRFLIYEGFGNEAENLFRNFCNKFNFKIITSSDSGVYFSNSKCQLTIVSEGSLQLWIKYQRAPEQEMIPRLCIIKGPEVINRYREIITQKISAQVMIELIEFLTFYFNLEFSEDYL